MNKSSFLTLALSGAVAWSGWSRADAATINVTSPIEQSTVWTADNQYVLGDIIFVRSNATLTIEAGTVIRGKKDADTPGENNPGTLLVTRGAKIKALGTEDKPIIFTDMNDDNYPGGPKSNPGYNSYTNLVAQWGGLAMCGRTYVAKGTGSGPSATAFVQLEGLTALGANGLYGGGDDDDDSGILKYVSVRYAGFGLAANNELNGVSMGGVGRETVLDHVEVFNNLDDGFEFFGGTVNGKYLVVWNSGDDSFDFDEGYRGKLQFLFAVQGDCGGSKVGSGISDRGLEIDGGNSPDNSQPFAMWRVYNMTVVGKGNNQGYDKYEGNVALYIRDNGSPQVYNSVFMDFGGFAIHAENEGSPTVGDTSKTNVVQRFATPASSWPYDGGVLYRAQDTNSYQAALVGNVFYSFGKGMQAITVADKQANAASDSSTCPDTVNTTNLFTMASVTLNITNPAASPIVSWTRNAPAGNRPGNVTSILPLAANDATNSPVAAPADGFFTPVSYRGAFSTTNNWLANWSTVWANNLTPNTHVNPTAPAISVAIVSNQAQITAHSTASGIEYCLESSYDLKHWHPITLFTGTGSDVVLTDTSPLVNTVQYRVVVP